MDLVIAMVPMLAFGSIGLISGKIGGSANQQTLGMTVGAFILALGAFFIFQPVIDLRTLVIGGISGLLWAIGQKGQFTAMQYMGVSVTLPLSTGMQLILNTVAGALLFGEWRTTLQYALGLLALSALVLGSYLTSKQDVTPANQNKMPNFGKGFRALLVSTAGFGLFTILITWAQISAEAIILPQSIGMMIGAFGLSFGTITYTKVILKNSLSGIFWGIGNICMLMSIQSIGLAVGFSLSQMGIIISTLGGIFILKEQKTKRELVHVILGCLLVLTGGIVLGYMKGL